MVPGLPLSRSTEFGRPCALAIPEDTKGKFEFGLPNSDERIVRRFLGCAKIEFGGKLKGETVELGLRGSEARSARGLEKRLPKSELGRRSGALGRFSEGML